jgi:hypothetical protein
MSASEGPLFIPEQLALEQVLGNGVAVDRDEGAGAPGTPAVQRLGHHLFAGPAFTENQHRCRRRTYLADKGEDGLHPRTGPQHVLEDLGPAILLERAVFLLKVGNVDASLQDEPQLVHLHRLAEEIVGARADGSKRVFLVPLPGDDDDLGHGFQDQ